MPSNLTGPGTPNANHTAAARADRHRQGARIAANESTRPNETTLREVQQRQGRR